VGPQLESGYGPSPWSSLRSGTRVKAGPDCLVGTTGLSALDEVAAHEDRHRSRWHFGLVGMLGGKRAH
jgi:hypothetical protein